MASVLLFSILNLFRVSSLGVHSGWRPDGHIILCLVLWQPIFFVHMFEKDMNLGRTVVEYCGLNCVFSNLYVEILIISTSECDFVWRQGLLKGERCKIRPLWTWIQSGGALTRGNLHRATRALYTEGSACEEATRGWRPARHREKSQPGWHIDFEFLFGTMSKINFCCLSHLVWYFVMEAWANT